MELEELWNRAVEHTEIYRKRATHLQSFSSTECPYIFLGESQVNPGDTVVRKGLVTVHRPLIIRPEHYPKFEGFDFEEELKTNEENGWILISKRKEENNLFI